MKQTSRAAYFLTLHFFMFVIFNLGHPVTRQFILDIKGPDYLQGLLLGVMALGGFFFAPLWGQIAQRYGYRIIALGPLGYAIGQIGFVVLGYWPGLVIFRFIAGTFASVNSTLHFVHLTHISSTPAERTKNLGIASLLLTASAGVGYFLGGMIGNAQPRLTFVVQIVASLVIAGLVYYELKDEKGDIHTKIQYNFLRQNMSMLRKYRSNGLHYIIGLTILNVIGNSILILSSLLPQLNKLFKFTSALQGTSYSITILLASYLSYIFVKRMLVKVKNHRALLPYLALISTITGLLTLPLMYVLGQFGWIMLLLLFVIVTVVNTIFVTVIQELLSVMAEKNEHSQLTGLNQSAQSIALFIGSFGGGILFAMNAYLPILIGVIIFALTVSYNYFLIRTHKI
ncbi:MAG: MFS transporter [Culicoidibacterales bacterium]